ncbi:MAG: addiction module protein [Terracidiphilus sp.]
MTWEDRFYLKAYCMPAGRRSSAGWLLCATERASRVTGASGSQAVRGLKPAPFNNPDAIALPSCPGNGALSPFWRYNLPMPRSFEEVRQIASELPVDQRILLANSLWESVDPADSAATEAELDAAWNGEIARRVRDELISAYKKAVASPLHFPCYLQGTRRVQLKRFPFFIVFLDWQDEIFIVAVATPSAVQATG